VVDGMMERKTPVLAMSAFALAAGCSTIPKVGEFHKSTVVNYPSHPIIMLFRAGEVNCEKTSSGFNVTYQHWAAEEAEGGQTISYKPGSTQHGSNVDGNMFGNFVDHRYRIDDKHYMDTYKLPLDCSKIDGIEHFLLKEKGESWVKKKIK